ncbi:hypothetical protein WA026_004611 [Henosepilachna vigintioctopunctata]|uniref:Uncharacterized protein n=1 Tax=Henosepilachna vigintioctopunctata TaxID=420089 RepID=A0AAW1VAR4_9CUCU
MLSLVSKGIYVTGQGERKPRKKPTVLLLTSTPNIKEAKAKSAPPPVTKKTRGGLQKLWILVPTVKMIYLSSLKPGMMTKIVLAFVAMISTSGPNQKRSD